MEGTWVAVDLDSTDPMAMELTSTISGTNDASLALFWLLGATRGPAVIKTERVGEVMTDRMVVPVDLGVALERIPADLQPVLASGIEQVRTIGIEPLFSTDVWVGVDDGLIHRVRYEFEDIPVGVSQMVITYDFHDFGVEVDPELPDPADVVRHRRRHRPGVAGAALLPVVEAGLGVLDALPRRTEVGAVETPGLRLAQETPVDPRGRPLRAGQEDHVRAGTRRAFREVARGDVARVRGPVERVGEAHALEAQLVTEQVVHDGP